MFLDPLGPLGPLALIYFVSWTPLGPFGTLGPYIVGILDIFGHFSKKCPKMGPFSTNSF